MSGVPHFQETLRKLALRDDRYIEAALGDEHETMDASGLDPKVYALVQLGALVALDAAPPSYQCIVENALAAGASVEEIVGALVALMPVTGVPRVTSAAPKLGLALGYDVDEALENLSGDEDCL
jgi:alkylhydroperoxidase/carboxymuconolactone decarboxylase family protein YurZ